MLSASSWSWVTKRKVMPTSRWIDLSSACIACRSLRSSAASGSSSSSTLGSVDQRAGERDALPLAAGELARAGPCRGRRARPARASRTTRWSMRGSVEALAAQAEADVAADVEVLEERVALEDRVDVALVRRRAGDVLAADEDRAGRRVAEAGDHPQRGGLAAARRARAGRRTRRSRRRGRGRRRRSCRRRPWSGRAARPTGRRGGRRRGVSRVTGCSSAFASGDQVQAGRPAAEQARAAAGRPRSAGPSRAASGCRSR